MPSIIIGIDSENRVKVWNSNSQNHFEIDKDKAIGSILFDLIPSLEEYDKLIQISRDSKEVHKITASREISQNREIIEEITIFPLVDNGINDIIIRIDDVTEKVEMENQIAQSRKMDAIGQLAGGIAHDFNNMLAGIMTGAQILKSPSRDLDDNSKNIADLILKASNRAAELTEKLLAFGYKGGISSSTVDINSIIHDSYDILRSTIDKQIVLKIELSAEKHYISGNQSSVQNALMNLAINSSHAITKKGSIKISTQNEFLDSNFCSSNQFNLVPGNYILIEVSDDGYGIEQKIIDKIFDPFFTTKEKGVGTGLGLSAVYGIVQNHRGAIFVESAVNIGTTFSIYLPVMNSEGIVEEKKISKKRERKGKVLLVDDEEVVRLSASHLLIDMGYSVTTLNDGLEAVEFYKKNHKDIDFIIMDMIMPNMNGSEAFLKLLEINKNVKVIISSGYTKNESIVDLKAKGLAGFIKKPYRAVDLENLLDSINL